MHLVKLLNVHYTELMMRIAVMQLAVLSEDAVLYGPLPATSFRRVMVTKSERIKLAASTEGFRSYSYHFYWSATIPMHNVHYRWIRLANYWLPVITSTEPAFIRDETFFFI